MTKPIHVTPGEAKKLERNLSDDKPKRVEDPDQTIRRLRAEVAVLRELVDLKQEIIDKLNREIGALKGKEHDS